MKIALCFNGQLRSYRDIYEYIEKNVLNNFDTDIFFHTWDDPNLEDAVNLYKPKLYKSEPLVNENFPLNKYRSPSEHFRKTTFFQFYSLFKAFQLKREYEIQNNFTYDVVIRNRFDSAINFIPKLNEMDPNKIYLPSDLVGLVEDVVSDYFAYSSSHIMDQYSSIYVNFDFLYNNGTMFNSEQMCFANLKLYNLINSMVFIDMNHLFPPGRRGCCPHSFFPP